MQPINISGTRSDSDALMFEPVTMKGKWQSQNGLPAGVNEDCDTNIPASNPSSMRCTFQHAVRVGECPQPYVILPKAQSILPAILVVNFNKFKALVRLQPEKSSPRIQAHMTGFLGR